MNKGIWVKGKQQITGYWTYIWASDRFVVTLDSKDKVTGENRRIVIAGEHPEWDGWKLVREDR